jgi:CBS domain containing-hemolysin-like protein
MVPRNEIEAIEVASSISVLEKMFAETGFSRIPVYEDSIDNIIGYAHHLQMFSHPRNIRAIVKSLSIVPETMSAKKLLKKLMAQQKTIAVVVDEFGGTAGLVTVEDLLEEIFGEIEDEHDEIEFLEEKISEKQFIFSGRLEIDYINEKYKLELPDDEEYETIAGFILYHHGRIPAQGEVVICGDYRFDILKAENPRIELIKMTIEE